MNQSEAGPSEPINEDLLRRKEKETIEPDTSNSTPEEEINSIDGIMAQILLDVLNRGSREQLMEFIMHA